MPRENAEEIAIEIRKDKLCRVDAAIGSVKRHIVTCVDTSETADGKPRVLGVFEHKEDAEEYVHSEIEQFADDAAGMNLVVDFEKMSAHTSDFYYGCEWNIEEIVIKL